MKKTTRFIKYFIIMVLIVCFNITNVFAFDKYEGWRNTYPNFTSQSFGWYTMPDSGNGLMNRLRDSYTFKYRVPAISGLAWRQDRFNTTEYSGVDFGMRTNTYYPTNTTNTMGYTKWFDSPYGIMFDYQMDGRKTGAVKDMIDFNKQLTDHRYLRSNNTAYIAVNDLAYDASPLSDAKSASMAGYDLERRFPVYLSNNTGKSIQSSVLTEVSLIGARNLVVLGGSGIFSEFVGAGNGYNLIRAGGIDRDQTREYLERLPNRMFNPSLATADNNGIIIQGIESWEAGYNQLYNCLVNESIYKDGTNLSAALSRLNDFKQTIGTDNVNSSSLPAMVLGVKTRDYDIAWECYYRTDNQFIYNITTPTYYKTVDPVAPTIIANPTSGNWNNTGHTVNLKATDSGSGILDIHYAWSSSSTVQPTTWNIHVGDSKDTTQPDGGIWYLWYYATDKANNSSPITNTGPYKIDKISPTLTSISVTGNIYTSGNTYWVKNSSTATVKIRGNDTQSGIGYNYLLFSKDNILTYNHANHNSDGTTTNIAQSGGSDQSIVINSATRTEDGAYRTVNWVVKGVTDTVSDIYYLFDDRVGNRLGWIESGLKLGVDTIAPTVGSDSLSRAGINANVPVNLTYTDTGSGVATKQYAWSTSTSTPTVWTNYTTTVTQNTHGVWYLHYKTTDNVGNSRTGYFGSYTINKKNLTANTVTILNSNLTEAPAKLIPGTEYISRVNVKNTGDVEISNYNVAIYDGSTLLKSVRETITLAAGGTKNYDIPFTPTTALTRTFTGKVDDINEIDEYNEDDNTVSISKYVFSYNIQAVKIEIFDSHNVLVAGDLNQNFSYTVVTTYKNAGIDVLPAFSVQMSAEGTVRSTQDIAAGLAPNTTGSVSFVYTPTTMGVKALSSTVDFNNLVCETNETDNVVNISRTVRRKNLRADSIEIVGTNDSIAKTSLTHNYEYRAMIKYTNDSDISINEDFNIALYEENVKFSTTSRVTATLAPGQQYTVYIPFIAKTRGTRNFKAVIDDSFEVEESVESDNTTSTISKKVNKVNVRAVSINIENLAGEVQDTFLIKGQPYKAKVSLINDGDINLSAFNLGLYDGETRIASLPIAGLSMSGVATIYTVNFSPGTTGVRTFTAFADDNYQIAESIETDNQVSMSPLNVYDLQLTNYRITSIVNPPSSYTYPLDVTKMPVAIKSGYNVTFRIDVIGLADRVFSELYNSLGTDLGTVELTKISDTGTGMSTWEYTYTTDLETPSGTIIYSVMKGKLSEFIYNYNTWNNWDGATLSINGSALDDAIIERVY